MKRRVCILQLAHLGGTRVPRKPLLYVGAWRLIDRALWLLTEAQKATGAVPILAVCLKDKELVDAAAKAQVEILELSEVAATSSNCDTICEGMAAKLSPRFDWVASVNLVDRPFTRLGTLVKFLALCETETRPFVATNLRRGLLWNEDGRQMLGKGEPADTKTNPLYHEISHLGYGHPVGMLDSIAVLAASAGPVAIPLTWRERIDIDTWEDHEMARTVAAAVTTGAAPELEVIG
jgi:hypothetical protein